MKENIKEAIESVLQNRIKHIGDDEQIYTGSPGSLIKELSDTVFLFLNK